MSQADCSPNPLVPNGDRNIKTSLGLGFPLCVFGVSLFWFLFIFLVVFFVHKFSVYPSFVCRSTILQKPTMAKYQFGDIPLSKVEVPGKQR